jgi:hypothetical protein
MQPQTPPPEPQVSTQVLIRIVIALLAVWTAIAGLVLLAFQGSSSGALGAGTEDEAAQRLLGAHLLVLVPVYLLLAWRPQRFILLMWLPFVAQAVSVLVIGYNMLEGDTAVGDGILAFTVSVIFVALLGYLWVADQRTLARMRLEAEELAQSDEP